MSKRTWTPTPEQAIQRIARLFGLPLPATPEDVEIAVTACFATLREVVGERDRLQLELDAISAHYRIVCR